MGSFERGPVTMLVEGHDQVEFPQKCITFKDGIDIIDVLVALWLDDQDIADYLTATYGIPTRVATFAPVREDVGGVPREGWTWSAEGGEPSELLFATQEADNGHAESVWRYMWHNGTAVSALDFSRSAQFTGDNPAGLATHGTLKAPMLFAQSGTEAYAGRGGLFIDASAEGTIYQFSDLRCEKPL